MVTVDLTSAGIIEVRVNAFTAEDAHAIADEILVESSKLVNRLSEQAHQDAVEFSREELTLPRAGCATRARNSRTSAARTASSTPRATCRARRAS